MPREKNLVNGKGYFLKERAAPLAHYPHMRHVNGFLFLSGVSARRPDGTVSGMGDIRLQTKAVLENIRAILQKAGADLKNLVDITTYLVDMKDYPAYNEVYNRYFKAKTGPTRTTVAVKELPGRDLLIEMKAVAVR